MAWGIPLSGGYAAYLLAACILNFQRALALFVITCLVIFILACHFLKKFFAKKSIRCLTPLKNTRLRCWLKRVFLGAAVVALILWLALDTAQRPEQLISFVGICMFILILFACSKHHSAIFLAYTLEGSSFVFGDTLVQSVFAFQSLPIIIFFGCVMSILYYLGLVQWVIQKNTWFLQITMGTTAAETLAVAGNIFVGMSSVGSHFTGYDNTSSHSGFALCYLEN